MSCLSTNVISVVPFPLRKPCCQGPSFSSTMFLGLFSYTDSSFGSLSHLWTDHRLSRETKLRLYKLSVCSTLPHCCTAWALTRKVTRMINGFNSRCLHVITGQDYRDTATTPVYDLVLAVRQRRMRYLGHVLRMPPDRIVRRALVALVKGGTCYPEGSLFDRSTTVVWLVCANWSIQRKTDPLGAPIVQQPSRHHSYYDSTLLPLPKSSITWLGGIFARLPPLAAGLQSGVADATTVA